MFGYNDKTGSFLFRVSYSFCVSKNCSLSAVNLVPSRDMSPKVVLRRA